MTQFKINNIFLLKVTLFVSLLFFVSLSFAMESSVKEEVLFKDDEMEFSDRESDETVVFEDSEKIEKNSAITPSIFLPYELWEKLFLLVMGNGDEVDLYNFSSITKVVRNIYVEKSRDFYFYSQKFFKEKNPDVGEFEVLTNLLKNPNLSYQDMLNWHIDEAEAFMTHSRSDPPQKIWQDIGLLERVIGFHFTKFLFGQAPAHDADLEIWLRQGLAVITSMLIHDVTSKACNRAGLLIDKNKKCDYLLKSGNSIVLRTGDDVLKTLVNFIGDKKGNNLNCKLIEKNDENRGVERGLSKCSCAEKYSPECLSCTNLKWIINQDYYEDVRHELKKLNENAALLRAIERFIKKNISKATPNARIESIKFHLKEKVALMKFLQMILQDDGYKLFNNRLFEDGKLQENELKILLNLYRDKGPLSSVGAFDNFIKSFVRLTGDRKKESCSYLEPWKNFIVKKVLPNIKAKPAKRKKTFLLNLKREIELLSGEEQVETKNKGVKRKGTEIKVKSSDNKSAKENPVNTHILEESSSDLLNLPNGTFFPQNRPLADAEIAQRPGEGQWLYPPHYPNIVWSPPSWTTIPTQNQSQPVPAHFLIPSDLPQNRNSISVPMQSLSDAPPVAFPHGLSLQVNPPSLGNNHIGVQSQPNYIIVQFNWGYMPGIYPLPPSGL